MILTFKIKSCIFASLLFLAHVGAAQEIVLNAMPLTMPQHLMRHFCFMRKKIEIGEKNHLLTLVEINPEKLKHVKHIFMCDCGAITHATLDNVRRGNVKSCGCLVHKKGRTFNAKSAELGEKHNMLTLVKIDPEKPYSKGRHVFKCDCGNEHSAELKNVRNGHTKSCGCIARISVKIKNKCVKEYLEGSTYEVVAAKYQVSCQSVKEWVSKHHVGRKCWESRRKYSLNEKAFSEITPESLYWAGFFAADGWVYKKNNNNHQIGLSLKQSDYSHLQKFKDFLNSDAPIKPKKGNAIVFQINNSRIARDLELFGITSRKSLTYSPPEFCLNSPDFWRGMVDGDGSIGVQGGKIRVMLCGSKDAVFGFWNWVKTFTDVKAVPFERGEGLWYFWTSCKHAQKAIQKMYENGGTSLDRKKKRVIDFLSEKSCKYIYI